MQVKFEGAFKNAQDRIIASGGKIGKKVNLDNIEVRDLGAANFEKGDVIDFPSNWEDCAFERKIPGATRPAVGILVSCNGMPKELYVGTLNRSVRPYDDAGNPVMNPDGSLLPRVEANGTANQLYRQQSTAAEGFKALAGKKIVISDIIPVQTLRFAGNGERRPGNQNVYIMDLK